jgi:hypothetical protein
MTKENIQQIQELKEMITTHCEEQIVTDAAVYQKLEALMPLVELIPILQEISENQKVNQAVNKRFAGIARTFVTIGGVITAIYVIISLIFRLEK